MTTKQKALLGSISVVLLGAIALTVPWITDSLVLWELKSAPLRSTFEVSGSKIKGDRHTYSKGNYGITEIGRLRIVFEGLPFTGKQVGRITLGSASDEFRDMGGGGYGNRRFMTQWIPHGSRCDFGGVVFDVIDGVFHFDGRANCLT